MRDDAAFGPGRPPALDIQERNVDIAPGRLAAGGPLANPVRSGRKQPQRVPVRVARQPFTFDRRAYRPAANGALPHMADSETTPPETAGDDAGYRVLARKYRPETFADLIGQEAMTRTLTNAFARGRIAQAYLLTGVRGIGKTTTARIIARALNCIGPDGQGGPTIQPCGQCAHCRDIMADRDVDVLEMDAASNNSVDNIREITEAARYRPAAARYKVYILDEAHMLSNQAFNALLKTLEEPPPHVKFIFATTEARRLPVTVLSRCQRFDLRRVSPEELVGHFGRVAAAEGAEVEDEALAMIARAADGSVRDGLSLLDQAIALAAPGEPVTAEQTRQMLGLADRLLAYDLFEAAMAGDAAGALARFGEMIAAGADPAVTLQDLLETTYWITRLAVDPSGADFAGSSAAERDRARAMAGGLSVPALTRAWQILSKGHGETLAAQSPRLAAEMTLIRLAYAANLPTPGDLIRRIEAREGDGAAANPATTPASGGAPANAQASPPGAPRAVSSIAAHGAGPGAATARQAAAPAAPEPAAAPQPAALPEPEPPPPLPAERPAAASADAFPDFDGLGAFLAAKGAPVALTLLRQLRLVRYAPGRIVYEVHDRLPKDFHKRLREELGRATDRVWSLEPVENGGQPSIADNEAAAEAALRSHPLVLAALDVFPESKLSIGRPPAPEPEPELEPPPRIGASDDGGTRDDNPDVVYDDDLNFGDWEPDD